jgi:hypothetical protein
MVPEAALVVKAVETSAASVVVYSSASSVYAHRIELLSYLRLLYPDSNPARDAHANHRLCV